MILYLHNCQFLDTKNYALFTYPNHPMMHSIFDGPVNKSGLVSRSGCVIKNGKVVPTAMMNDDLFLSPDDAVDQINPLSPDDLRGMDWRGVYEVDDGPTVSQKLDQTRKDSEEAIRLAKERERKQAEEAKRKEMEAEAEKLHDEVSKAWRNIPWRR